MKVTTEREINIDNVITLLDKNINKNDDKKLFTVSVNKQLLIDCRDLLNVLKKNADQ